MASFIRRLHQFEDVLLALLLSSMVFLAVLQIAMRNLAGTAILWIDPLLRVEVLWLGLLGAAAATRGGRHITIDVLEPVLKGVWKQRLGRAANLMAAVICTVVAWHSARFVHIEMQWLSEAFAGISSWVLQLVIPFSFGLMALRFALQTCWPLAKDVPVTYNEPD